MLAERKQLKNKNRELYGKKLNEFILIMCDVPIILLQIATMTSICNLQCVYALF